MPIQRNNVTTINNITDLINSVNAKSKSTAVVGSTLPLSASVKVNGDQTQKVAITVGGKAVTTANPTGAMATITSSDGLVCFADAVEYLNGLK